MNTHMTEQAHEAFERNKATIVKQMSALQTFLSAYNADKKTINWGHVGDMASISRELGEILEQFGLK